MLKPRFAVPAMLVAAAVTAAGVAAATRHAQGTQAAGADFSASLVPTGHTRTCTGSDGTYQETAAIYRGSTTNGGLNGALEIRAHSVVNTSTGLGWLEGRLRIRGTSTDATGTVRAAIANGAAVGSVVGKTDHPEGKLVASFSATFSQGGGFTSGKIGSGSANGAGVMFVRGDCRRTARQPFVAVFRLHLTPGEAVPPVAGLKAGAHGSLTLDLTQSSVVFNLDYSFPSSVTITGLAVHRAGRGANGGVVLDAAIGSVSDPDGHGLLTKQVNAVSSTLLQALLAGPRGYYVELTTSAGSLRDQLRRPDRD
jgi:hypothetical protein